MKLYETFIIALDPRDNELRRFPFKPVFAECFSDARQMCEIYFPYAQLTGAELSIDDYIMKQKKNDFISGITIGN